MALPNDKYMSDDYLEQNPSWDMEDSPWKAERVRQIIAENHLNCKSVCEVGCGAGGVLSSLNEKIPTASFIGYDIAPAAEGFWETKRSERVDFVRGDFFDLDAHHYDLILLLDVLEHVVDPHQFLSELKTKADHIVIHFPLDLSALSVLRETPLLHVRRKVGHIHYFTKGLAFELLEECDMEVVDWNYTGAAFTAPQRTLMTKVMSVFRRVVYVLNKSLGVRLLGGETLMVLVRSRKKRNA